MFTNAPVYARKQSVEKYEFHLQSEDIFSEKKDVLAGCHNFEGLFVGRDVVRVTVKHFVVMGMVRA